MWLSFISLTSVKNPAVDNQRRGACGMCAHTSRDQGILSQPTGYFDHTTPKAIDLTEVTS